MIVGIQNEIERLGKLELSTGYLKNFKSIRIGDYQQVPTQDHPALTIEWSERMALTDTNNHLDVTFEFDLCVYCTEPSNPKNANFKLQHLIWGLSATEASHGVIPWILNLQKIRIYDKYTFMLSPRLGSVTVENKSGVFVPVAIIHLEAISML